MTNHTPHSTADEKKRNLTRRFILSGAIGILLIAACITAGNFYRLQHRALAVSANDLRGHIQSFVESGVVFQGSDSDLAVSTVSQESERTLAARVISQSEHLPEIRQISMFDSAGQHIMSRERALVISAEQRPTFNRLVAKKDVNSAYFEHSLLAASTWSGVLLNRFDQTDVLVSVVGTKGKTYVLKIVADFSPVLARARTDAAYTLASLLTLGLILFLLLYASFRRGIATIDEQEAVLSDQIDRLSNLLSVNKSMQRNMKTASARAVELNEQFLRRVGADLHDGPAQMIGFAVLRLNQVSRQEAAKQLSHEFHAVREALDESLEEIRGISSGLVLPELEQMTLEQCLRKVVTLHSAKSDADVTQFYQDLPDEIPLPIKICTYRFVQEGLNNAHRHGQAKKCRLNAFVKDDMLHLSLKDNGMGFRKSTLNADGAHLGLMGLKDRIESLGGSFSINSELGVGTALKLSISLRDDN